MRRKLGALLRTNDFHSNLTGYKGRVSRIQPVVKSVRMYLDRKEAIFMLPVGSDPQEVFKKSWIFQQVFGLEAELSMIDARTIMISIYTTSIQSFIYNAEEIDQSLGMNRLPVYVGKDRHGDVVYDMVKHPHLLVAGETGSGKSAALRAILTTLIRNVDNLDLYCADLKRSEFHLFKGIAQAVVYETHEVLALVTMLRLEMKRRGDILEAAGVAHVDDLEEPLNYIILAVDEVALLKKEKDIMQGIEEISTIGRALGVYLVLSMQRPDAQVLDGKLKQNLTVRMALKHADGINSRITIDSVDAANIQDSEKGRMVLKLDGLKYVQGPNLGLSEAKELLKGYKYPLEIRQPQRASQESQDDIIELGVL
ncbi:FtsK/SpoIIIE domain-containing protein [Paenibacillus pseudetheri]|nr:FtsK/SpoIIIE domain-containing protein [Paenibacillus pseudetheri]